MLDQAGRTYGCGRLQYEYITETTDPFGSTEATMALPYWTDGCMDTIDGVLFESSTTTPFHFLDQAEYALPGESSNPVSFLTYPTYDLADGIRHLQFEDVRYFLAVSPQDEAAAKSVPGLVKIASAPGFAGPINNVTPTDPVWDLYLIKGAQLVTPLDYLPEVEPGASAQQWLNANLAWWEDESYWPVELAQSGPRNWPRAAVGTLVPSVAGYPGHPDDCDRRKDDELDGQLRRRPPRVARAREGALLPQLARERGPRSLSCVTQSHGSRADGAPRDPHLRNDASRPGRQAGLAWRRRGPRPARFAAPTSYVPAGCA